MFTTLLEKVKNCLIFFQDYNDPRESELDIIPEMTTQPEAFSVQRGDTAKLPCEATVAVTIQTASK
jgi:hypothetical protein